MRADWVALRRPGALARDGRSYRAVPPIVRRS